MPREKTPNYGVSPLSDPNISTNGETARWKQNDARRSEHRKFAFGHAAHARKLRYALSRSVSRRQMLEVWSQIILKAKEGNLNATKLLLEYTVGQPIEADLQQAFLDQEERIEQLEKVITQFVEKN